MFLLRRTVPIQAQRHRQHRPMVRRRSKHHAFFSSCDGRQDLAIDEIRGLRFRHNRNKPAESVAKSQNRKTRISSMAAARVWI